MNRFNRTDWFIVGGIFYLIALYFIVEYQTTVHWGPEGLELMMSWCQEGLEYYGVADKLECIPNQEIEFDADNLLVVLEAM